MKGFRKNSDENQEIGRNTDCQRWLGCFAVCWRFCLLEEGASLDPASAGAELTWSFHGQKNSLLWKERFGCYDDKSFCNFKQP